MKRILKQCCIDLLRSIRLWHHGAPIRTYICLLAFTVSFGYACIYQIVPSVDARKFHEIAIHLVQKHTFCFECNVPLSQDNAIRDIGPGYQFFLASIYFIFGVHIWIVWFLQSLMHAIVVAWIWRLMKSLTTSVYAISPIILYAVHPDIVQSNAMLMADSLFVFLFIAVVLVFYYKKSSYVLGALLGILTMVRPTGLPVCICILLTFLFLKNWKSACITLCMFVIVQMPWAIRNAVTYDHWVYNSVVGGLDIWVGLNPNSTGEFNLDTLPEITQKISGLTPDTVDRISMLEVKKIIREKPIFAIKRTIQKFFKLFALTKTSGFWFHYYGTFDQSATIVLSIVFNFLLLLVGCAGIIFVILKRDYKNMLLRICFFGIVLMSVAPTISVVVNRYRIPMLPFFTLFAGYWLVNSKGRERIYSVIIAVSFLFFSTGVDMWGSSEKILEHVRRIRA